LKITGVVFNSFLFLDGALSASRCFVPLRVFFQREERGNDLKGGMCND
jgi:hypothetical protein